MPNDITMSTRMASITHATLWPNPPEIRAPEGRGTAKSMDITVPSSVDPDRACGLCLAQRTIRTPFHPSTLSILLMRTMHPALFRLAGFQLAVTVLLAIVPFVSATSLSQPSRRGLGSVVQKRDWPFPPGWVEKSCYTDDPNRPTLTSIPFWNPAWEIMSVAVCANLCVDSHTALAGLKNGSACFCGNITTIGATETSSSNCQTPCAGNHKEFCGGPNSLSLWWNGVPIQAAPTITQSAGEWDIVGCYSDSNAKTLDTQLFVGGVTIATCVDECFRKGYNYAGVEFANECWCGNGINPSGTALDPTLCSVLACSDNSLEYCGAAQRMIIYKLAGRVGGRAVKREGESETY